jgi:predicted transcriptional regulator
MKVLLSIKPMYAEKILNGEKLYEFRRTIFKSPAVTKVVIYASSPISKVIGEFEIDHVLSMEVEALWNKTMEHSGIDKEFYDSYFDGKDVGHAIKVKHVERYLECRELHEYDIKYPPQSFAYLS